MFRIVLLLIFLIPCFAFANDSSSVIHTKAKTLRGYKRLLYNVVLLHPKMNSPLEKDLLRHYLIGSGTLYAISDTDFIRLKNTVSHYPIKDVNDRATFPYKLIKVDLNDDDYFGWALGNIVSIVFAPSGEMVSFADVYDFNKSKKGSRSFKNELLTRIFYFLSPSSAHSFIVTYHADGYLEK